MRLRAPVEVGAGVRWSQFSRVTGNVLWDLPPGLRQAVSGAQVAMLFTPRFLPWRTAGLLSMRQIFSHRIFMSIL